MGLGFSAAPEPRMPRGIHLSFVTATRRLAAVLLHGMSGRRRHRE